MDAMSWQGGNEKGVFVVVLHTVARSLLRAVRLPCCLVGMSSLLLCSCQGGKWDGLSAGTGLRAGTRQGRAGEADLAGSSSRERVSGELVRRSDLTLLKSCTRHSGGANGRSHVVEAHHFTGGGGA